MRTRVETIGPRESAGAAIERMRRGRIRHLVVQDGQKIVGLVSDRDIAPDSERRLQTVADFMSTPALTCAPDTTLRQAANLLRGRTIGCLPVVAEGRIAGIVTITDLLELIGGDVERPFPKTRRWVTRVAARESNFAEEAGPSGSRRPARR